MTRSESFVQIDPVLFTKAMLTAALERGAELRNGAVKSITTEERGGEKCVTGLVLLACLCCLRFNRKIRLMLRLNCNVVGRSVGR